MKIVYFILCVLLLLSCNNQKTKSVEIGLFTEIPNIVKKKLDSVLVKGVLEIVKTNEHLKYPDIPLNNSFITIIFKVNPIYNKFAFSDSIVDIHYNAFGTYKYADTLKYKGILDIDGYNVAIFDWGNFGDRYYNVDSLKYIPLERFKPYPMTEYITTITYSVHDGKLKYTDPHDVSK